MPTIFSVNLMDFPDRYHPDFDGECRLCGTSPTVIVEGHVCPDTELCGVHFFKDPAMIDWQAWNDDDEIQDPSEEDSDD